jgi:hypothetical protein
MITQSDCTCSNSATPLDKTALNLLLVPLSPDIHQRSLTTRDDKDGEQDSDTQDPHRKLCGAVPTGSPISSGKAPQA